ncbi:MAG: holo-ACP synthase [Thiohalospira sp.]
MYKEIVVIKSVKEIETILFKHADDFYFIEDEIKSSEDKNIIKSLGARYLIKKSIIDFLGVTVGYHDIEIQNEQSGKPVVTIKGKVKEDLSERNIQKVHVSISHSKHYVSVLVILEK